MAEKWDVYTIDRKPTGKTCLRGEQGNLSDDEIYAKIAFQEQFFYGVLVR